MTKSKNQGVTFSFAHNIEHRSFQKKPAEFGRQNIAHPKNASRNSVSATLFAQKVPAEFDHSNPYFSKCEKNGGAKLTVTCNYEWNVKPTKQAFVKAGMSTKAKFVA